MTNRPLNAYFTDRILAANPLELVRLLYDNAQKEVETARRRLAEGDIPGRSAAISKAVEILIALDGALDHGRAPEMSRRLAELYDYLERRLLQANMEQADRPLAEVRGLLETLGGAWKQVAQPAVPATPVPAWNAAESTPALALQG
jgi:flagellar protein FliS